MQAVRQCSVCAGRLLRTHRDFSLLQSNKSVFRSEAACMRFLSTPERPEVQKLGENVSTSHESTASLSDASQCFDIPNTQRVENLSQDSLIRKAASVVTDSSSTFLSQTTLALIDALANYSKAVHSRIAFQRRYLASLGKLTPAEEDVLLQVINGWRAEASERLNDCKQYESTWITAVNLCNIAAETADAAGAQQASVSMRTTVQASQSQVEEARKVSADADKKLAETKVEEIQRMAEYAAFLENGEEHEIHEAYLRED